MHPYHYNLGTLFRDVVAAYSTQPALRCADREFTYGELGDWVDSLGGLLLERGVEQGDVIAIGHGKHPLSYALMLAAIRLGVAYVNIDLVSPVARTARILQISGARQLFFDDPTCQDAMSELAATHGCPLWLLDEGTLAGTASPQRAEQDRRCRLVDGACIAYIMFTSGSTGMPKGVAVTHQNVLHFIAWGRERFGICQSDNFANLSPMYFDNSVFDFFVALFSGASLTPVSRALLAEPYELVTYIGRQRCTVWFSVPSLLMYLMIMKAITPLTLPGLRAIVFGGEGYPKVELRKLYELFSGQATLVNVYGPTECTCICSAYDLRAEDFGKLEGLPPLGVLNPNFDYRILDDRDHDSRSGELCLIGPNVAAGYFNDLERTAASFVTIGDTNRFMKRMYRTGDLVREEAGMLHFVGRKDNQIKHMGYRIELEEIEHALVKLPQVDQAAVVHYRVNAAYGKLVGFVATRSELESRHILDQLRSLLPEYMIPSKIVVTADLPKNSNGKVDRQKLKCMIDGVAERDVKA